MYEQHRLQSIVGTGAVRCADFLSQLSSEHRREKGVICERNRASADDFSHLPSTKLAQETLLRGFWQRMTPMASDESQRRQTQAARKVCDSRKTLKACTEPSGFRLFLIDFSFLRRLLMFRLISCQPACGAGEPYYHENRYSRFPGWLTGN